MMAALAVVAYTRHKARRKAQAEVAFDAALQDSGLGLDDAFEQVSVRQKTTPPTWTKVTMLWLLMPAILTSNLPVVFS